MVTGRCPSHADVTRSWSNDYRVDHHERESDSSTSSSSDEDDDDRQSDDVEDDSDHGRHKLTSSENRKTEAIFVPGRLLGTSESLRVKSLVPVDREDASADESSSSADDADTAFSEDVASTSLHHLTGDVTSSTASAPVHHLTDDVTSSSAPFVRETRRLRRQNLRRRQRVADRSSYHISEPSDRSSYHTSETSERNFDELTREPSDFSLGVTVVEND